MGSINEMELDKVLARKEIYEFSALDIYLQQWADIEKERMPTFKRDIWTNLLQKHSFEIVASQGT